MKLPENYNEPLVIERIMRGMPKVPVRNFDGPDELVSRYHVHETGVITDRQLIHFYPTDKYPPPQRTALIVALDDEDWPDEYVTELGEFSKGPLESPRWTYIGGDEITHRVAYWARFPALPRGLEAWSE